MRELSSKNRLNLVKKLQNQQFDLIVIGGGITGAGIALDAASRGMSVALVEQSDFASGTSSKSTKLIHGGLRYLKNLEFGLVRMVGKERAIVHRIAPHLVIPEKMLLPFYLGGSLSKFSTEIALKVYDFLAEVEEDDKYQILTTEEVIEIEPQIKTEDLQGGALYAEYRTDDARLTMEVIKTAVNEGAICMNYVKAEEFIFEKGKIQGIQCRDMIDAHVFEIKANAIVNAAGPWVDEVRKKNDSLTGKRVYPSKGIHIVIPHKRFPLINSVYFDVGDGRRIFAIPRQKTTYIGTTDTPFDGNVNYIIPSEVEAQYLIDATNNTFLDLNLKLEDIESSWAGLRPLIYEEGKSPSEMSRKDELFVSKTGLITIAGGKLTGYRKMAEKVVNKVCKKIKRRDKKTFTKCRTDEIDLIGGPFDHYDDVVAYQQIIKEKLKTLKVDVQYTEYLTANYGRQTDEILTYFSSFRDTPEIALLRAELKFCLENEMVMLPLDFIIRRTGRLYFHINSLTPFIDILLTDMQKYFGWKELVVEEEKGKILEEIEDASIYN